DLNTVATWQTMLRDHARAFRHETEAVRLELQPIFFAAAPLEQPPAEVREAEVPDLRDLVTQILAAAVATQEAILASFPAEAPGTPTPGVESVDFWRSLLLSERLGAEFDRSWVLDKDIR
ncbi:MAG: hypothetical protein Q7V01_05110, partial [Vicinamibacterales bacterium]|nr:hypothetical protein [Vicinamibacterales bacterium]